MHSMKQRLTDTLIERQQQSVGSGRLTVTDMDLKGFFAEIRARSATFGLRTSVGGKMHSIKLGNYPVISTEDARTLCLDRKRALAMGEQNTVLNPRKEMQFTDFVHQHYLPWYKMYRRSSVNFVKTYRNHLRPRYGDMMLHDITRQHIQQLAADLREGGYAASTVNNVVLMLRGVLKRADEWDIARVHPSIFKSAPLLQVNNTQERFLSQAEALRLQRELDRLGNTPIANAIRFLLYTGSRKRETLDAEWRSIDFERKTWRIQITKSGKPRTVYLTDHAMRILAGARAYQSQHSAENDPSRWIFANPLTGKPYGCIYYTWNAVRCRAGLADVRLHDLRHSFASTLVNAGVSLYEVQHLLGHAKSTTTQRYAHLAKSKLQETVQVVDRVYGRE
jgi:integrase